MIIRGKRWEALAKWFEADKCLSICINRNAYEKNPDGQLYLEASAHRELLSRVRCVIPG